jgi:ABC-type multidrug transport system ATPase subunit
VQVLRAEGRLRPGSLTLVLAPPGGSKTALLRAITQRLAPARVKGSMLYGGLTPAQAVAEGINLRSMLYYVDQVSNFLAGAPEEICNTCCRWTRSSDS